MAIVIVLCLLAYLFRGPSSEMKKIQAAEDAMAAVRQRWGQDMGKSLESHMDAGQKSALELDLRELDRIQGEALVACGRSWTPHP